MRRSHSDRFQSQAQAMTLIEVVMAISLLAILGLGLVTWLRVTGRGQRSASVLVDAIAAERLAVRCLIDDLTEVQGEPIVNLPEEAAATMNNRGGAIQLVTTHQLAGDPNGPQQVRWHRDPTTGWLLRTQTVGGTAADRCILIPAGEIRFSALLNGEGGRSLWLSIAASASAPARQHMVMAKLP